MSGFKRLHLHYVFFPLECPFRNVTPYNSTYWKRRIESKRTKCEIKGICVRLPSSSQKSTLLYPSPRNMYDGQRCQKMDWPLQATMERRGCHQKEKKVAREHNKPQAQLFLVSACPCKGQHRQWCCKPVKRGMVWSVGLQCNWCWETGTESGVPELHFQKPKYKSYLLVGLQAGFPY